MSEIARFREQQEEEERARFLALYGPAIVGKHDAIIARMKDRCAVLLQLFEQDRDQEAYDLWESGILEQ